MHKLAVVTLCLAALALSADAHPFRGKRALPSVAEEEDGATITLASQYEGPDPYAQPVQPSGEQTEPSPQLVLPVARGEQPAHEALSILADTHQLFLGTFKSTPSPLQLVALQKALVGAQDTLRLRVSDEEAAGLCAAMVRSMQDFTLEALRSALEEPLADNSDELSF